MRVLSLLPLLLALACTEAPPYSCGSNAACDNNGEAGTCEATGYCSFADSTCATGRRYGEYAGDDLGGTCVGECGTEGGPCCAGSQCGDGLVCDESQQECVTCGGLGDACCAGRTCSGGLTCQPVVDLCA